MFEMFVPDIYQKSVYSINYEKLKKKGIKCLLFDLDNTIIPTSINKPDKKIKELFYKLKNMGFKLIIVTNCPKIRVEIFKNELQVDAAAFALKPRKDKFLKIMKLYNYKPSEIVLIGDQLVNDVYASNKLDITSILVNPMSEKDIFTSFFNRMFEKFVFNFLNKKELFIRGKYYE